MVESSLQLRAFLVAEKLVEVFSSLVQGCILFQDRLGRNRSRFGVKLGRCVRLGTLRNVSRGVTGVLVVADVGEDWRGLHAH